MLPLFDICDYACAMPRAPRYSSVRKIRVKAAARGKRGVQVRAFLRAVLLLQRDATIMPRRYSTRARC